MNDLGIYGSLLVNNGMADTRAVEIEKGLSQTLSAVNGCDYRNLSLLKQYEPKLFEVLVRFAEINMERVPELE